MGKIIIVIVLAIIVGVIFVVISRRKDSEKEMTAPEIISFCKAHLKFIQPGMFCFNDYTFSNKLQDGKTVRGIVINAEKNLVDILLPEEKYLTYNKDGDYREHCPKYIINDNMLLTKYVPELSLWQYVYTNIAILNKALEEAQQPTLSGLYWSWFNDRPYFIYNPVKGERYLIDGNNSATLRYVLEIRVKSFFSALSFLFS